MKTAIFIFLVGAAAGAFGFYYFQEQRSASAAKPNSAEVKTTAEPAHANPSLSERAREEAKAAKAAVATKLADWHLTPEDISNDLARTGEVVRTKAQSVGNSIAGATSNARIVTTIKTKYALEKELSARAIEVECDNGQVTLRGTAASHALIAKAVALALDTDGVTQVTAKLTVVPAKN
jgi:BON domain